MTATRAVSPVIVLMPDLRMAHRIAGWLRDAGLGLAAAARTPDEAIFILGRKQPSLLIIDELISEPAEQRLLRHIACVGGAPDPLLVRLVSKDRPIPLAPDRHLPAGIIEKPFAGHDVIVRVGSAMRRPDLIGRFDRDRDPAANHLETARRMQIALLPGSVELQALQSRCGIGIAALYRSGEALGGDFWGIWGTSKGRLALAIVDFAGHGLSAALNTFRLHALLSHPNLPRSHPKRMTALLNEQLTALLPIGQYATMLYLRIDPKTRRVTWCCAGGPPPIFVSADRATDLGGRGLPLGVKAGYVYRTHCNDLPAAGVLAVFSDGLFENGGGEPDVPRTAIAEALAEPARIAAAGDLTGAAQAATARLAALRDSHRRHDHSDDVVAICVALGRDLRADSAGPKYAVA